MYRCVAGNSSPGASVSFVKLGLCKRGGSGRISGRLHTE